MIIGGKSMKKIRIIVTIFLLSVGCFSMLPKTTVDVSAAKAVKVKAKSKSTKSGKFYIVLTGYTKKGKKVWTRKSDKHIGAQVSQVTYKKRKNQVYLFDGKKLKIFRLSSGKKLKQIKLKIGGGHSFAFDSKDNIYLTGYFYNTVYKLDKKGRIKWRKNIKHLGLSNAYGAKYKKGILTVYYESSPRAGELDIGKHFWIKFNSKNGKIKSYRR